MNPPVDAAAFAAFFLAGVFVGTYAPSLMERITVAFTKGV
jgi:hypothetical protein